MPYGITNEKPEDTKKMEQCILGIKGINKQTGKPYTESEKIAICKSSLGYVKNKASFIVEFSEKRLDKEMEINVVPVGKWDHPIYGEMNIAKDDISEFVEHFDLRKGVPITVGHAKEDEELPAVGWFKELINKGDKGLWAIVEWTDTGLQLLKEKCYKYFSPEFYQVYEDPETREKYNNVLVGGALTNTPYFKGLEAIVSFSENSILKQFKENMTIEELKNKKVEELSDEEKKFIKTQDLSDEDKELFKTVLDDKKDEDISDDKKDEEENKDDKKDEDNKEGEDDSKKDFSEKSQIKISATELKALKDKADKGEQAMIKITAMEVAQDVDKFIFSENNKDGKVLPKSKDKIVKFMIGLNESQRNDFKEIINSLPKAKLSFEEIGDEGSDAGNNALDKAIRAKMATDKKMTYSDALSAVVRENPESYKNYK